jgi:hypothetical protein
VHKWISCLDLDIIPTIFHDVYAKTPKSKYHKHFGPKHFKPSISGEKKNDIQSQSMYFIQSESD